jgi:hypothetical protein
MKNLFIPLTIVAVIFVVSAFSNAENTQQVLTVRVNERMGALDHESEILVAEPGQPVKDFGDLGNLLRDNGSNIVEVTKCLNLVTSKGWKLAGIACSNLSSGVNSEQLITIYTFTK